MDYIRKLVSVKKIDNILPIEGADRIELGPIWWLESYSA